jgi:hypothetical protein
MRWVGHVASMGEESVQGFGGSQMERDHLKDQGIDGRMGSEWILGRLAGGSVEWIQLTQVRDQWWAFVNMVMNLRVLVPQILLVNGP